jgi:hypothetical protein
MPTNTLPSELEMLGMLTHGGAVERGQLVRRLRGKYVIRAEGVTDLGPGNFFNGPFISLAEAKSAALRVAASEAALRRGNALPRVWPDGSQRGGARAEVVRIYQIQFEVPGIQTVAASQPESGTVIVRAAHRDAIRQGKPWVAHEYRGGENQLELPVAGMRKKYNVEVVKRIAGFEHRVTADGTRF